MRVDPDSNLNEKPRSVTEPRGVGRFGSPFTPRTLDPQPRRRASSPARRAAPVLKVAGILAYAVCASPWSRAHRKRICKSHARFDDERVARAGRFTKDRYREVRKDREGRKGRQAIVFNLVSSGKKTPPRGVVFSTAVGVWLSFVRGA